MPHTYTNCVYEVWLCSFWNDFIGSTPVCVCVCVCVGGWMDGCMHIRAKHQTLPYVEVSQIMLSLARLFRLCPHITINIGISLFSWLVFILASNTWPNSTMECFFFCIHWKVKIPNLTSPYLCDGHQPHQHGLCLGYLDNARIMSGYCLF